MADKINETTVYYTTGGIKTDLTVSEGDLIPDDVRLTKVFVRGSDGDRYYRIILTRP